MRSKLLFPELSYRVCGLCFKVHNTLGRFRSEKSYADLFARLLAEEKIPFDREYRVPTSFDGEAGKRNVVDFLIDNKIILEMKVKPILMVADYYQLRRYLVAANKELGILLNFRQKYLRPKRVLNSDFVPYS